MTALIVAVKGGYTQSVKEILKRNPNVNLTDKDGNTALMIASKEGHTEIVQDLLDAGTYVNIPDRVGYLFQIGRLVVTWWKITLASHTFQDSSCMSYICFKINFISTFRTEKLKTIQSLWKMFFLIFVK